MKKMAILILALAITGCATFSEGSKRASTLDTYGVGYDEVWELATVVVTNYGLKISGFNKETGLMRAYRTSFLGTPMESVTINVRCDKETQYCRVSALSMPNQLGQYNTDFDPLIIDKMREILEAR